ncbi:MAG: hypothetical protein ACWGOX_13995 [Desulforhopalus sp.]
MSRNISLPHPFLFLLVAVFLSHFFITTAYGNGLVSARYLSASGKDIVLSLAIGTPAPASLIVEQYLPPGTTVLSTSPRAKKIDNTRGNVKWLFRNTASGNLRLSITLRAPINGGISATVRYRDPQSGAFTELRIAP